MGSLVNPGHQAFLDAINEDIYIDKSLLISFVNQRIGKRQKYLYTKISVHKQTPTVANSIIKTLLK
ncbi:hypothetical protein GN277_05445 [Lachnospiraceae bacterium WCA-9-b2]|uniref:Uncharacterized protein n=1 Tax=Sporofaciens musculi TaxID=2681861 RepID=A0A7X3SI73_9FIRM|nr:hypothetical protein [Sporofaciens musculi]MXP74846.1 hypothetical protein [Sporofaciens musculi]